MPALLLAFTGAVATVQAVSDHGKLDGASTAYAKRDAQREKTKEIRDVRENFVSGKNVFNDRSFAKDRDRDRHGFDRDRDRDHDKVFDRRDRDRFDRHDRDRHDRIFDTHRDRDRHSDRFFTRSSVFYRSGSLFDNYGLFGGSLGFNHRYGLFGHRHHLDSDDLLLLLALGNVYDRSGYGYGYGYGYGSCTADERELERALERMLDENIDCRDAAEIAAGILKALETLRDNANAP